MFKLSHWHVRNNCLLLLLLVLPLHAAAQRGEPQCPCAISLRPVATFSSESAGIAPSLSLSVARLSSGEYAVSHQLRDPAILMYDPTGALLRVHGRRGGGPGELSAPPRMLIGNGDTLFAFDNRRLLRFDRQLRHLDTRVVDKGLQQNGVVLGSGRIVVDERGSAVNGTLSSVQIVSLDGGPVDLLEPIAKPFGPTLLASSAGGNGFWTGLRNSTHFKRYNASGQLQRQIEIMNPSFKPWTDRVPGENITLAPQPRNTGLSEISPNLLLVLTLFPDRDWKSPLVNGKVSRLWEVDGNSLWDTVLSLVDVRAAAVVASLRVPNMLSMVEGSGLHVFATTLDRNGHVITTIWSVTVEPGVKAARN